MKIQVAASLLVVLRPCERRARPSCRGSKETVPAGEASSTPETTQPVNAVDDDDVEIITPPEGGMCVCTMCLT